MGQPGSEYPFPWAIYRWIDGQPYSDKLIDDERLAAEDLAEFVLELRETDRVAGAPRAGRKPLGQLAAVIREAIARAGGVSCCARGGRRDLGPGPRLCAASGGHDHSLLRGHEPGLRRPG